MNNNAALYGAMALILNTLHNITYNSNTMFPSKEKDDAIQDIRYLQQYIQNNIENKTKDIDNDRIMRLKCEEDLVENSNKLEFMVNSLTRNDNEGCILKQLVIIKNIDAVKESLNHGANVNGNCGGSSILHAAVATNDEYLIQVVLDKGADFKKEDSNKMIPVQLAASEGYDKAVTKLAGRTRAVKHGDSKDKLPHLAAKAGHVSVLNALHDLFPQKMVKETNRFKETPLLVAASNGHLEAVKTLIDQGSDLNHQDKNGNTVLYKAIDGKHNDVVDYLLSLNKFDVNAPNKYNNTPFHLVLLRGQTDLANKLIHGAAPANIYSEGADGQTALHFAAESNMGDFLKRLLAAPIGINKGTIHNETPLHVAARKNSKEAALVLINWKGVDVNARNSHDDTPLHLAAESNAKEIAMELLKHGADLSAKNKVRFTPYDVAIDHKNYETALILK